MSIFYHNTSSNLPIILFFMIKNHISFPWTSSVVWCCRIADCDEWGKKKNIFLFDFRLFPKIHQLVLHILGAIDEFFSQIGHQTKKWFFFPHLTFSAEQFSGLRFWVKISNNSLNFHLNSDPSIFFQTSNKPL